MILFNEFRQKGTIQKLKLSGVERRARTPAGKRVQGNPAGAKRRGGSRTARGKRVPGVEINLHIALTPKKL
ncbi:hypothetical protein ACQKNS_09555 [Peribacillus sp. NPDC094092]|uniref:hypothetical protein n=1 Tax=Peribacillus sp. NPDC094092 TaxID=3390611 RepID=UPI003CFECF2B